VLAPRRFFGKPGGIAMAVEASSIATLRAYYYLPAEFGQQVCFSSWPTICKASEVLAVRWIPLILRELMSDVRTFNNIHR
jgi:hypothetical protein